LSKIYFFLFILLSSSLHGAEKRYPDYDGLGHRIYISSLRAGNHDESGENEYYFIATAQAQKDKETNVKEETKKQEPISLDSVTFGELTIKSLDTWKHSEPIEDNLFTDIIGDSLRELTSNAMRSLKAHEQDIHLVVKIDMYEKNKKFFFFGEDQLVGSVSYEPAKLLQKFKKSEPPVRPTIKITDDKGTDVVFSIRFTEKPPVNKNSEDKK